jgi:hypothetical protein
MKINVLTNNSCPNSKAFNCPLLVARNKFKDKGFDLSFFFSVSKKLYSGDVLFVNSNVFRPYWQKNKNAIFGFLHRAKQNNMKIIWFDTTDSTWCTQFEVLPFVDKFLKSQIFADKNMYFKCFKTGRIFTDFFDKLYKSDDVHTEYFLPTPNMLDKVDVSWNTCFENYTRSRFGIYAKFKQKIRSVTSSFIDEHFNVYFTPADSERKIKTSCRIGLSHSRTSVVAHRKAIIEILEKRGISCGKIPLEDYFLELEKSLTAVGPFGVGEITLRDYEIIICGAALLKPEMGHLKTWPELFVPEKTYIPFKWDLSDFAEKLDFCEKNPDKCLETAKAARKVYSDALSENGMEEFTKRLLKHING